MNPLFTAQLPIQNPAFMQMAKNFSFPATFAERTNVSLPENHDMLVQLRAFQYMQLQAIYRRNAQLKAEIKTETQTYPKSEFPIDLKSEIKQERFLKTETSSNSDTEVLLPALVSTPSSKSLQEAINPISQPVSDGPYIKLSLREQLNFNAFLLRELDKIVRFIIANMGKDKQAEIEAMRNQYLNNQSLLQTFDKLTMKYYSAKKCKEDIVRYILRKAFKVMKTSVGKEAKVCGKKASLLLCKKYFQSNFSEIEEAGVDMANGDEILEFLMPYRKNSKNKTMNTNFVVEVFSSKEFCHAYEKFLEGFHDIIQEDNDKKIEKLVNFLAECVKKDCISKLGSFSRLPWLEVWIEDTEKIALSLLPSKVPNNKFKKTKF